MKKAKVSKGIIHHVWPNTKADGRVVELPQQYRGGIDSNGNEKPIPDCIIDVEDDVQQGWVWNEHLQRYAPLVKKPVTQFTRSILIEVVSEKLGISYEALFDEIKQRKVAQLAEQKQQRQDVVDQVNISLAEKLASGEIKTLDNTIVKQIYNEVNDGLATEEATKSDDSGTRDVNL